MPEIEQKLRTAARKVQGWKSQLAILLSTGLLSSLLIFLVILDRVSPMQESTNLKILLGLAVFSAVFLAGSLVGVFLNKPRHQSMARKVEQDNPELLDIYNCAIDLLERKPPEEMNSMEKRVLEEAAKRTSNLSIATSLLPKPSLRGLAVFSIAVCCGFLVYSQSLQPIKKAIHSYVEWKTGEITGVLAMPGDGEFPRGSDVQVHAHIYRGIREASIEYQVAGGGSAIEPMRPEAKAEVEPLSFKFLESADKGIGSVLETPIPHGIIPGQAIEITANGEWADGIHKVIDAEGKHLILSIDPPKGQETGEGKLKPLPAQEFYFYGIHNPVKYRVITPELTGAWHQLTSFIPPDIKKATWKITPPPYTKLPAFEHTGYGRIRLPEGGLVELEIEGTPPESMAYIVREGNELEIDGEQGHWHHHMLPSSETAYQLLLRTPEKREFLSPSLNLEILPDEPPIVEIRKPAKDQQLKIEQMLKVEAYGVDDYGLSQAQIVLRLPDGEKSVQFPINPVVKQKTLHGTVRLADLNLEVGDYFSYYVEVADNKPGDPQWAQSGIYFVEIIPEEMDPMEGQGESPKEIPLRNLINENKRLLRETYTGLPLPHPDKQEHSRKVTNIAHELGQDMNRVYSENKENFQGELESLFKGAMEQIEEAEATAAKSLLDQTLTHSEDSLRRLIKIAAMLRKPPAKSKKPSKSEDGEKGESQAQPQEQGEQKDQQQNLAEEFKEMQENLAAAQDLLKRQQALNPQISRNASTGRKGESNQKLAGKQAGISKDTKELRDNIYGRTGKYAFADPLEKAEQEMDDTKDGLEGDDPAGAQPHGLRAEEALQDAVKTIEGAVRQLGTELVKQLAQQSQSLSQQQGELSQSTEAGQKGDGGKLKNGQQHINRSTEDLLSQMTQVARALEKVSPKANEALFQAAGQARKGGIEKSGKRAENALNYEIFKKAIKEQEKIQRELDKTTDALDDIGRKLANEGNEILQKMLQELAQQRRNLPGMDAEEAEATRKEIGTKISELEATAQNVMLQNLVQQLKHGKFSDEIARNIGQTNEILGQAQQVLQTYLWQDTLKEAMQHNRETTAPPRKYKSQVQEYFRRLAEGTL